MSFPLGRTAPTGTYAAVKDRHANPRSKSGAHIEAWLLAPQANDKLRQGDHRPARGGARGTWHWHPTRTRPCPEL